MEGLAGGAWKQLYREYPSVEAEAHAALDVGDDDLHSRRRHSADRLRAPLSVILVNRAQDREYHDHHPDGRRGGERHREQAARADDAPQRRRALQLAQLSGLQLPFEAEEEVVAHAPGPIRLRTAARPRLTRLRTTASEVPGQRAISPYGRSSITCARIASRCSGLSRSTSTCARGSDPSASMRSMSASVSSIRSMPSRRRARHSATSPRSTRASLS